MNFQIIKNTTPTISPIAQNVESLAWRNCGSFLHINHYNGSQQTIIMVCSISW